MKTLFLVATFAAALQAQPPAIDGKPSDLAVYRYIDIKAGDGAPYAAGKKLTVHYTGWLRDGKKFDSSVDRNQTFDFVQGRRQVITGWDIGFEGMKVGGKRRLFIPWQLAYGEAGSGPIPPKSELIFDVELMAVSDATTLPPGIDAVLPLRRLQERFSAISRTIPEDKYNWRPAPSARTVAEVIAHSNATLQTFLDGLNDTDEVASLAALPAQTRDAAITLLETKLAAALKLAESARNGMLLGDAKLLGEPTNRRGLLAALNNSLSVDLGRLTVYAEAMGVAIPWKPGPLE